MPDPYASSSYFYSSTTNSSDGTTTTGHRYSTTSRTESDGSTTVTTAHQDLGQPAVIEERRYDRTGQEQLEIPGPEVTSAGGVRQITEVEEDSTGGSMEDAGSASAFGGEAATQFIKDDVVDRGSYDLGMTPFGDRVYNPALGTYDPRLGYAAGAGTGHPRGRRDSEDSSGKADTRARDDAFVTEEL